MTTDIVNVKEIPGRENGFEDKPFRISFSGARKIFWIFALTHFIVWTFLPWLIQYSPGNKDVIESLILSKEWVMGSIKHPPLPWWVLESVYQLTGRAEFGSYMAAQLWGLLGLWSVWRLSREYVSDLMALIVVFSAASYRYFNLGSISYTTSVPPVSIWCFVICFFALALKYNKIRYWIITGLALGVGLLCKYSLGILVLTILLFMFFSPRARKYWKTSGPWLSTLAAFLVFLPHFIWVVQNDFVTIQSAGRTITDVSRWMNHLISPLKFALAQLALFVPVTIGLIPLLGIAWKLRWIPYDKEKTDKNFERNYLAFMIYVPVIMHILTGAIFGAKMRPAYGSPLWTLIGLWFIVNFQANIQYANIKKAVLLCFAVIGVIIACYILNYQFYYWVTPEKPSKIHFPGIELGSAVSEKWHSRFGEPCPYISGDWILAGQAAIHMKERPSVLCYYNGAQMDQKMVGFYASDKDLNEKGGIIVWELNKEMPGDYVPEWLFKRYPKAAVSPETIIIPYHTNNAKLWPLHVRFAIVPPGK